MSSESSGADNFSSTEDIELQEYGRRSNDHSDSGSSADFTASGRRSIKENEIEEDAVNDVFTTSLNTSDEKHHEFDIERTSLEGISPKDLNRTKKSSTDREANALTRKASSLDGFSIRRSVDPLEGPPPRMASSLDTLNEPSTGNVSSVDPMEGPSAKMDSSLDPLRGVSTRSLSFLDSLEGPPPRMASSLDPLKEASTRILSSLDSLEGLPPRMASRDPQQKSATRSLSSLDSLERFSAQRSLSLDLLRGSSARRASSLNPLEGPSTQTVWFPDSEKSSVTKICVSDNSEFETNEPSNSEAPSEEYEFYGMMLVSLINFLMPYSRQIRHSKYFLWFYVALLALPCSAGYMSSRYWYMCHWCIKLPVFVFWLGIGGMFMIIVQILSILSKRYFAPPLTGRELTKVIYATALIFYFFLLPEMITVFICDPDFTPSKANDTNSKFCIKIYYDYTYYLNIIVLLVHVLLMLIHVPGLYDPAEYEEE